jgi:hypothetical protein
MAPVIAEIAAAIDVWKTLTGELTLLICLLGVSSN